MGKITPIKIEYNLKIKDHAMKACSQHLEDSRMISFYFDEKKVAETTVPPGDMLTDDDVICDLVSKYCKNSASVYADLFRNHSDKVHIVSKHISCVVEDYGVLINADVTVEKGRITTNIVANNGDDTFTGSFKAESFSDVLEKVRLFTMGLSKMSEEFSTHINELSNDMVEKWINWE